MPWIYNFSNGLYLNTTIANSQEIFRKARFNRPMFSIGQLQEALKDVDPVSTAGVMPDEESRAYGLPEGVTGVRVVLKSGQVAILRWSGEYEGESPIAVTNTTTYPYTPKMFEGKKGTII